MHSVLISRWSLITNHPSFAFLLMRVRSFLDEMSKCFLLILKVGLTGGGAYLIQATWKCFLSWSFSMYVVFQIEYELLSWRSSKIEETPEREIESGFYILEVNSFIKWVRVFISFKRGLSVVKATTNVLLSISTLHMEHGHMKEVGIEINRGRELVFNDTFTY